jgi:hypothetical protein
MPGSPVDDALGETLDDVQFITCADGHIGATIEVLIVDKEHYALKIDADCVPLRDAILARFQQWQKLVREQ